MTTPPQPSVYKYFFPQTNGLHDEIISLHNFILPTATALWNFRETIDQEFESDSFITATRLANKFNKAPGTRQSTNLIIPFRIQSWETQRERLAEMTLINIIALFEIWCADICDLFQRPDLAVKFQHPTNSTGSNGIRAGLRELQCEGSPVIADSIQMSLKKSKKYSYATLDNLLKCFRYFKEVRNCLVHRGRKCDGKLWGAQSVFLPVATTTALGMEFVPEHQIVKQNDDVHLSFHGVLGFTEVILRIAITVDAELCATPEGERILLQRIAERTSIPTKREKLFNLFTTIGWSNTHISSDLVSYLERSGILTRNSGIPYKIDDQPQP